MAELADVVGDEEGVPCNRMVGGDVCDGIMEWRPEECSCHLHSPCPSCEVGLVCSSCDTRPGEC